MERGAALMAVIKEGVSKELSFEQKSERKGKDLGGNMIPGDGTALSQECAGWRNRKERAWLEHGDRGQSDGCESRKWRLDCSRRALGSHGRVESTASTTALPPRAPDRSPKGPHVQPSRCSANGFSHFPFSLWHSKRTCREREREHALLNLQERAKMGASLPESRAAGAMVWACLTGIEGRVLCRQSCPWHEESCLDTVMGS